MITAPVLVPASVVETFDKYRRIGEAVFNAYKRTYRYAREKLYESLAALDANSPRLVLAALTEAATLPAEVVEPLPLSSELRSLTIHGPHSPPSHPENLNRVCSGLST